MGIENAKAELATVENTEAEITIEAWKNFILFAKLMKCMVPGLAIRWWLYLKHTMFIGFAGDWNECIDQKTGIVRGHKMDVYGKNRSSTRRVSL